MAKKRANYPYWAFPSPHAFRVEKRKDLRVMKRAAEELRNGCAYMPDGGEAVEVILEQVDELTDMLSVKRWGR